jgi:hypothetical protein
VVEKEKLGIEETLDVVKFADKLVGKLADAKADDGKIDSGEVAGALLTSTPAGLAAYVGCGDITEELKDLDDAERSKLLAEALPVIQKLVGMFVELPDEGS